MISPPAPSLDDLMQVLDGPSVRHGAGLSAVDRLRASMAVSSFFDLSDLEERASGLPDGTVALLLRDCLVGARDGRRMSILRGDVRQSVLRSSLADLNVLRAAIETRIGPDDVLSQTLRAYVHDKAPPLDGQTVEELASAEQVVGWLEGIVPSLPDLSAVTAMRAREELLRPLREIAGPQANFAGRRREMSRLRAFVGVLEAGAPLDSWRKRVSHLFNAGTLSLMPITGVGGAGKSTLVAKFLLDHVGLSGPRRIPFAYLDFDRASLAAHDPAGLLLEMSKQLVAQYPDRGTALEVLARSLRTGMSAGLSEALEESSSDGPGLDGSEAEPSDEPRLAMMTGAFGRVLADTGLADRSYLLVLDSFEEAQYASGSGLAVLWDLLLKLHREIPALRVVVSGRCFPTAETLPGGLSLEREMVIDDLDALSARSYLLGMGFEPSVSRHIVAHVGLLPLSLRLASEILRREGSDGGLRRFRGRTILGFRQSNDWIVAQLYSRILGHIHDEDVRSLAHPGLVVRLISPDVIRHVMAPLCHVVVPDDDRAISLYDEMRREVALVVDEGDHIRHRPDVRARMLGLMRQERPDEVRALHEAAATYWKQQQLEGRTQDEVKARAEEVYHLLSLTSGEDVIRSRWLPGISAYLRSSLDDLGSSSRDLALTLIQEDDPSFEESRDPIRHAPTASQAQARLALRRGLPEEALRHLDASGSLTSTAIRLRVQALEHTLAWPESALLLRREAAARPGDAALQVEHADVRFRLGEFHAAFDACQDLVSREGSDDHGKASVPLLEAELIQLACSRILDLDGDTRRLTALCSKHVSQLATRLRRSPRTMRRYALLVGDHRPDAVATFLRIAGPTAYSRPELALMAQALAAVDERFSAVSGQQPGVLARALGIAQQADLEIPLVWARFVAKADPERLFDVVMGALDRVTLTAADAAEFGRLVRFRRPEWRPWVARALSMAFVEEEDLSRFFERTTGLRPPGGERHSDVREVAGACARAADIRGSLAYLAESLLAGRPTPEAKLVVDGLTHWENAWMPRTFRLVSASTPVAQQLAPETLTVPVLELVTRFYEVSFATRLAIAGALGLLTGGEIDLGGVAASRAILTRARDARLLGALAGRLGLHRAASQG